MTDAHSSPPAVGGGRIDWADLPFTVRHAVEAWLGMPVVDARTQHGGFSPGAAARLTAADGRRVFLKATAGSLNLDSPIIYRRERDVMYALPPIVPAPRLLWSYDEGGWVALLFEYVDGLPPVEPWRWDEVERVVRGMVSLGDLLTPTPISAPAASDAFATQLCGWGHLQREQPDGLDGRSRRHLARLVQLEALAPEAVAGETLLHCDVRADNLLLTEDTVYFIDWPHARVGAPWVDLIGLIPSMMMQGGPDPDAVLRLHPAAREADPECITATIAALAGYFTHRSLQPPPRGIPTVRPFQAAQGARARRWLAQRLGLE